MTDRAFTLVETIIVISMTTIISLTLGSLLIYFYKTNSYTMEQSIGVAEARRGVEEAMLHLREASYGSDGSYPIASAATSSITFFSNIDNTANIERVTYILQGHTLYRVVATPVGSPATYTGAIIATSTTATSIVNGPTASIFRYFDTTGTELLPPVDISKISSVTTTIVTDVNVDRSPISFTLSGAATLRNLRTQL